MKSSLELGTPALALQLKIVRMISYRHARGTISDIVAILVKKKLHLKCI